MKHSLGVFFLLTFLGCHDTITPSINPDRYCSAQLNGEVWESETFFSRNSPGNDSLHFSFVYYSSPQIIGEKLLLFNVPMEVGRHTIQYTHLHNRHSAIGSGYQIFVGHGDILGQQYYVQENSDKNWVEITSIATENNKIKLSGLFQIQLTIDSLKGKQLDWAPDTLSFTNGEFVSFEL